MKRNAPLLGFFIGMLLPMLGIVIMYFIWFHNYAFNEFLNIVWTHREVASKVFSLGLLINILPFWFYTNKRLDHTARGILVITILYAVAIVLIRFNFFM